MLTISYQLQTCSPIRVFDPITKKIMTTLNWYKHQNYKTLEQAKEVQQRYFKAANNCDRPSRILKRTFLEIVKEEVMND